MRTSKTTWCAMALALLALACPVSAEAQSGELQLELQAPENGLVISSSEGSVRVEGGASVFGGVKHLDLFLVLDTSDSLKLTDPKDHRVAGAIGLVESFPEWTDIQIGIVRFDRHAELVSPLTSERDTTIRLLRSLDTRGTTNIAGGIETALAGFEQGAREGSTRIMLIFTDGKSNPKRARRAMQAAKEQGIAIHGLLLGSDREGRQTLHEISSKTGGSFIHVTDPNRLPEAFMNLRTTGIDRVTLRVNESAPVEAELVGGAFSGELPLAVGENNLVVTATALDGATASESVTVTLQPPGCSELKVQAVSGGRPALSISQRSVEIVVDASRSMWGQIDGRSKMDIAKATLGDAVDWLPSDLALSLRAYGSQDRSERRNCRDTQLLVPPGSRNRGALRQAIAQLKPNGQTPLGYAIEQTAQDLQGVRGERAVVLVTDGIESCDGNAVAAARALQQLGSIPVHVIGFGFADQETTNLDSLRAIAAASGGQFLTAANAAELKAALGNTVGTSYQVFSGHMPVARGILGDGKVMRLPSGSYEVRLNSAPPQRAKVTLESEVQHTLMFEKKASGVSQSAWREVADYSSCDEPLQALNDDAVLDSMGEFYGGAAVGKNPPAQVQPQTAVTPTQAQPTARKREDFEIQGGVIEVWQNLRPDRKADWGVVVKHSTMKNGSEMVWRGNDLSEARQVAQGVRDTMRRLAAPASPNRR